MKTELPSTLQLVDAPELAALHVLEAALAIAERALLAAYPELEDGLYLERPASLPLKPGSLTRSPCTSLGSRPRSSATEFNSALADFSAQTPDVLIEGGTHSPPSVMAIVLVAHIAPRCVMAINKSDQPALNKRASQHLPAGARWLRRSAACRRTTPPRP